jgi:phenylacetic acid degradation operon negative regulatory protein
MLKSIKKTSRGIKEFYKFPIDLFDGFDMTSVYQKFYGTYYANKESQRIREKIRKEWEIKQAIKKLQSMDYIKINDARKKIYLTEKGLLEFIKFRIHDKKSIWDKKWRVVIFDIPEKERSQRDFLRKQLKWLGFKELQKSVWIFPYDIKKETEEMLEICDLVISSDIRFMTVEKIEDDKDLRDYFNL